MNRYKHLILPVLATLLLSSILLPATAQADELDDLKARFKKRYPKLEALNGAGKIGETHLGFVEAVNGGPLDAEATKLVAAENSDRTTLYAVIAKKQNTTPALVAERNAKREFSTAKSGEWLKFPDGWKQKS